MSVRPPPHSMEAEESVLGSILVHPRKFMDVTEHIPSAGAFYHPAHGAIYEAMLELDGAGKPIDVVTVAEQMRQMEIWDKLQSSGGADFLTELMSKVVTAENVGYHAQIVAGRSLMRGVIAVAAQIQAEGYAEESEPAAFIADAERRMFELTMTGHAGKLEQARVVMARFLKIVEQRFNSKSAVTGFPTGIEKFDSMTAGLQPGHLIIIGGRPSMGKTSVAFNWVVNGCIHGGLPGLILSFEVSKEEAIEKLVCIDGRIDTEKMRVGALDSPAWVRLSMAGSRMAVAPLLIDDMGATLTEIRSKARRWRMDKEVWAPRKRKVRKLDGSGWEDRIVEPDMGILVIDYLQMVSAGGTDNRDENRAIELGKVSRGFKMLARELRVPVVAICQLGRQVEQRADKHPLLADLKESGAIEQDADEVCGIYRDEVYSKEDCKPEDRGVMEIDLLKQRNGGTGRVRTHWEAPYTRIEDLAGGS